MQRNTLAVTAGFAMFSMFFGSGNLVFPLLVGASSQSHFGLGTLGLFATGIFVPFLGLLSMIVMEGKRAAFFQELGRAPAFILTLMMLALMGPVGVSARCIIVAFAGTQLVVPELTLPVFSFLFCVITAALCWQQKRVVTIIGHYLTPFLLASILLIIAMGVFHAPALMPSQHTAKQAFHIGVSEGYQTMDLLAAFFFCASTITYLKIQQTLSPSKDSLMTVSLKASCVGIILLGAVYAGFVYLGAAYAPMLVGVPPEKMLVVIAGQVLGDFATPVMAATIGLACLTTLIILTNLFAEFVSHEVTEDRLPRKASLVITLVISFVVSLSGFTRLAHWLGGALSIAYPALIALALAKIAEKVFDIQKVKLVPWCFYTTLILAAGFSLL
ncbi:MAG: hypothetical protein C0514_08830 [Candidatus Puniceispirillum sp.]|nr:hypothetical protein [Candidatus Puniceispirillum sp.]